MQFLYSNDACNDSIIIKDDQFLHLKARRVKIGDEINIRNLKDELNYVYEISQISKKNMLLNLKSSQKISNLVSNLSIAWSVVDIKIVEKTLPYLNEMGLKKLILVYAEFSQKNFKFDINRCERILISSCEQCGRNSPLEIEIYPSIEKMLEKYKNIARIDFNGKSLNLQKDINEILFIGPEGGFSKNDIEKIPKSYSLNSNFILRSQTATIGIVGKLLL
ncbi:16S rRNA (uracil(1498)-N(3))-methyltransferase [Campylobacter sputorum]|uniref:16S rRNA (uracil(1498)-N(3))-methyltransferase n=1 Tax=Campylobacter sputorum TaxID=206 RepID=UPI000B78A580|nr:16S rRNA (uracil(1498)-N(3))-methyltransferase [Campylobacter sputorum]ASM37370.1 16S rRNA m3U1498 methyltransferase [Campylobacter sputorum bv. faecalis CCUG 20703]